MKFALILIFVESLSIIIRVSRFLALRLVVMRRLLARGHVTFGSFEIFIIKEFTP
ncbi:MAG: hypothetical protein ACJA2B_002038, partial [Candidatus Endobugula sp.]